MLSAGCYVVSQNYAGQHCHHCCRVLGESGLPSPLTSKETVLFCSLPCLTTASTSYHKVEAALPLSHIFSLANSEGYDEISGAVMMVIRAVTQQPRELLSSDLLQEPKEEVVQSDRLRALASMVTHHGQRSEVDLLSLTMKTRLGNIQRVCSTNWWELSTVDSKS